MKSRHLMPAAGDNSTAYVEVNGAEFEARFEWERGDRELPTYVNLISVSSLDDEYEVTADVRREIVRQIKHDIDFPDMRRDH